jgi:hypothetical protein
MTIEERLIALRADITPSQARAARRTMSKKKPGFWLNNALAFEWHGVPPWFAVASFKYAERLRRQGT